MKKIKRERVTYQNLNEVPSTIKNTKQRKQEVEAVCLEPSAASPATPRQGEPSIPPGTAFQAPHCAQTGTPQCPAATTRDWPPGTMIGGWGRQLKKQGKDCVQPWPESNIPELMAKVKANKIQRCSTVARNMRAHVPNATKATCFTMKFLQK